MSRGLALVVVAAALVGARPELAIRGDTVVVAVETERAGERGLTLLRPE